MKQFILLFLIGSISLSGCKPGEKTKTVRVPVTDNAMFEENKGNIVTLIGTYEELNVNKRPGGEPTYIGRAMIRLSDGAYVLLETHDAGIRPTDEIAQMKGKKVKVKGTAELDCLCWGNGEMASIVGHCIRDIVFVKD